MDDRTRLWAHCPFRAQLPGLMERVAELPADAQTVGLIAGLAALAICAPGGTEWLRGYAHELRTELEGMDGYKA